MSSHCAEQAWAAEHADYPAQVDSLSSVMPALGAGIHVFCAASEDVDGRDKPGHDAGFWLRCERTMPKALPRTTA
jgi:hypothetical protein